MTSTGLSERQAATRLQTGGRNELLKEQPRSLARTVVRQLTDTVIVVLLVAACLTAAVGDAADTAIILAVVVLNTGLGAAQEVRSGRALAALADLTAPHATVVRGGVARDIEARDVVVGDLIRLAAGDVVAADAHVESAESLQVDESMLTGESVPVSKEVGAAVYAGTVVVRGRADTLVVATAERTAIGGIARSLRDKGSGLTPVQRQLAVLGRRLAIAVTMAAVVVGALNLAGGRGLETSLVLAISLAVAAIPESLPAVVSLSLALAGRRMAARGVLARRLAAVEALGSISVIGLDKTGTLTAGRMSVAEVWTPTGDTRALLEAAALCSDASVPASGPRDDPTEVALVEAATAAGIDVPALRRAYPRLTEVPFDARTARMTTTHALAGGARRTLRKGSPEAVLGDVADDESARAAADRLAGAGYRVLAVARQDNGGWRLLGFAALTDPPRPAAPAMISAFRRAGVRPIMITGDHLRTARAVADAVGIDADEVHARVRPDQKTSIVRTLRERGDLVAMTGDGVNDAPALRAADIGVAMGRRGTEVAKQAAALVLTDDDLSAMVPAIAEGRRAYDNLRRFLHYALSGGVAEVLIMLVGPLFGFALPLQAGQILWINLLTHGLPGVAMGNEAASADVLTRPPRSSREQLLDSATARRVAVLGAVIAAVSLLAGLDARRVAHPWQTTIFLTLTCAQLAVALALRPAGAPRNRPLLGSVALNLVLAGLAVWWAPLRELLRTQPLAPRDVLTCLVGATIAGAVAWLQAHRLRAGRNRSRRATDLRRC
jgi:P-type Ca2+ transporter type 2C